jgi:hypothetical protein
MGWFSSKNKNEEQYLNSASVANGKYNPDKHVAAQCKDSSKGKGKSGASKGGRALRATDWLGR